jgi:O-antigen/teichoic acid export membrane protein
VNEALARDLRWLRKASGPAARLLTTQVAVQGLAAAASFLFVRGMSKQEFGWLTIATGFTTTVSVLADSGMGAGLQAISGRAWKDPTSMGQLLLAARETRRRLAVLVILLLGPAFAWLLVRNGSPIWYASALAILAGATVWFTTEIVALSVACRMYSRYQDVQLAEAVGSSARLIVALGSLAVPLNAALGAAASLLAASLQRFSLRRVVDRIVPVRVGPEVASYRKELQSFLKPLALPTLFFVIQGQLGIWLLGVLGKVESVADLGALSRFAVLLSIITAAANQVAAPSFARAETPDAFRQQVRRVVGLTLAAFSAPALVLVAWPELALLLLGAGYTHLVVELRLVVAVSLFTTLTALTWSMATAKGWVRGAWLVIPVAIGAQLAALLWLSVSTVTGALTLSLVNSVATMAVYGSLVGRGYGRWRCEKAS